MRTIEEIKSLIREPENKCDIFSHTYYTTEAVIDFLTEQEIIELGMGVELKYEYKGKHIPIEFTKENIMKKLEVHVCKGFKSALDKISLYAQMEYNIVCTLNWILDEGLDNFKEYKYYGLPVFKATALKYGFNNPIGQDTGLEDKYKYK